MPKRLQVIRIGKFTIKIRSFVVLAACFLMLIGAGTGFIVMRHLSRQTTKQSTAHNGSRTTDVSAPSSATMQKDNTKQPSVGGGSKTGTSGSASGSKTTTSKGSGGSSSATSSGSSGSGSSSSGGGSQIPAPSPPGPLSALSVSSLTATASPISSTQCHINQSISFSTTGSGNVSVTWLVYSNHTASAAYNPVVHTFTAAGTQSDSTSSSWQGLESGDSYRVSALLTSGSITQMASPITISSCASAQSLQAPNQASYMSSPVAGSSLVINQNADSLFTNSCSMNLQASFSVNGPGSVQPVYVITSSSSIGATLYSQNQWSFTGPGSATDSSYIRMPHLPSGLYSVTVKLNVLGDPSHSSTYGPVASACS
ncbi:MAG TPA: hypothetical protein VLG36_02165 [Candidatus Chromulinivoraceae bacterium]|nr:hypothetical protein [Candidatus Chromulinivoraceae bacterium]